MESARVWPWYREFETLVSFLTTRVDSLVQPSWVI